MPLHIPIAGVQIATYEADGTSGLCKPPDKTLPFEVIPEMTSTLTLATGDQVKLSFQANIYIKYKISLEIAIRADGVVIGYLARGSGGGETAASTYYSVYPFHMSRTYTAVADGDVVFDVVWRGFYGDETKIYVVGNERKLIMTVLG